MLAATISVTTTKAALYDLLVTATRYARPQEGFAEIYCENNPAEANDVFIGDANVTTTNFGASLRGGTPKDTWRFGFDATDLNTRGLYFISSAGTVSVHITLR